MKKLLLEYSSIIANTIIGFTFGIGFFLLFINFYHFKEVNNYYVKDDGDLEVLSEFKNSLDEINNNINSFNPNTYNGVNNAYTLSIIKSKLDSCVNNINDKQVLNILSKKKIDINDVYILQKKYQNNVVNECLVKQLYDLVDEDEMLFGKTKPFIKDNINQLRYSSDYLKNNLKNNSSYFFNSDNSKLNVFDVTKDSYFQVLVYYRQSIQFVKDISIWYRDLVVGEL